LDKSLCPVKLWPLIVWRILSNRGTNKNSPVLLVKQGKKIISITSDMILNLIHDRVETNKAWYPLIGDRYTLDQKQGSNGNGKVPGRHPHFLNRVHWKVVKHSIPEIYQDAIASPQKY
jgi:hypothetical protein